MSIMLNFILVCLFQVQMADALRQDGKFWVVVAVIFASLGGLVAYLISIDKKLTRLERQKEGKEII